MRPLNDIRNYMGNYHVKSGVYHYYRNEFKQALGFLRKALSEDGSLGDADRKNATCYLALSLKGLAEKLALGGEPEAALGELQSAMEVRSDFPDLHFKAGQLLERMERREEAIDAYRRALDCHAGYVDAAVHLGYCLTAGGRTDEAAAAFETALALRVERLREPFARGIELLRAGERDRSLALMHQVFLAAPHLAGVHLEQALEHLRLEDYERALAEFDRALQVNPGYPDLHNFRGIALYELGRPAEAATAFCLAAEFSSGQIVPRLNLAFALLRAGEIDRSEAELESVLQTDPDEPVARAKLEELRQTERRGPPVRPGSA